MPIYQTARFAVKAASLDICQQAIKQFVDYVDRNEPGTLLYVSLQETADPTRFVHVMAFADEAAMEIHRTSGAVQQFTSTLYPELAEGVDFTPYAVFAGQLAG